ncbi:MAG TPA: CoA pyrophosphatase [Candidatus Coprocola pullicola]|nr:CoA pyrophosphatase [Candidatus Coprocola pullicola]
MKQPIPSVQTIKTILENRIPQPIMQHIPSSVMLLLFSIENELHLLFTKRAEHLAHQPGDISFPGGRKEKNETPLETALRETQEELGILPEQITLLGKTDFMLTTSGALITPFVGYVSNITIEEISFNKDEVAEIFTVPLSFFRQTQPEVHFLYLSPFTEDTFPYDRITGGKNYPFVRPKIPELFYQYKQYTIWGITAQIAHHAVCLFFQEEDKK